MLTQDCLNGPPEGKLVILMQKHCSIRDIKKNGFLIFIILISVNVHVTFKSVKVMYLNGYFSY